MQICMERIGENAILMHFDAISPDIRSSGELENIPTQIIDHFPAVWNYGKLSANFILSSVKVIDTVGFLSFLKLLLEQLLKFLLIISMAVQCK